MTGCVKIFVFIWILGFIVGSQICLAGGFGPDFNNRLQSVRLSLADSEAFAQLPDRILEYVTFEKSFMNATASTRLIVDSQDHVIGGYSESAMIPAIDAYHPRNLSSFWLSGFWIDEEDVEIFGDKFDEGFASFYRELGGIRQVLFLVHPKSQDLYAPLMEKYANSRIEVEAIALSSFRSLLVAIGGPEQGYTYHLLKVSLDQDIYAARRILSRRECALSVANSILLPTRVAPELEVVVDPLAFSPRIELLSGAAAGAGMIFRQMPSELEESSNIMLVPLFALLGKSNLGFLQWLVDKSGESASEFIRQGVLSPVAFLVAELIFNRSVSLEIHGQNLLLRINRISGHIEAKKPLGYRDMGGANALYKAAELAQLPILLQDSRHFYFATFAKDAGNALEQQFFSKVLFHLTKQFIKSENIRLNDEGFSAWLKSLPEKYHGNWTLGSDHDEFHKTRLKEEEFFHYGYFAKIFAKELIYQISQRRQLPEGCKPIILAYLDQPLSADFFSELIKLCLEQPNQLGFR